ncbi:asl4177 [Nostoc sp. PCC 7120 = FACHB-418]|nr:asl4177 [Nostoc sp. PCC 7120 = FACHB-418]
MIFFQSKLYAFFTGYQKSVIDYFLWFFVVYLFVLAGYLEKVRLVVAVFEPRTE